MKIYTVGHSNHKIEVFKEMLADAGVTHLIDVRSKPVSRFCPHFNRKALEQTITDAGLKYIYRGDALGGFGTPSSDMAKVLSGLLVWREANPDFVPAMMCAEKSPFECHRYYWLANWIKRSSNFTVINIMPPGIDNWEADLSNLPTMATEEAENLTLHPWLVAGRLTGFETKENATSYCVTYDIDVTSISRRRSRE